MNVGIFYLNKQLNEDCVVQKLGTLLDEKKLSYKVFSDYNDISGVDILIVLGGDGSILRAATIAARQNIKIIGVNFGRLGFLTEFESENLPAAVELIISNYQTQKCAVLEVNVDGKQFFALNEVVFQRECSVSSDTQVVKYTALIDGKAVDNCAADGFIVCTPTGSTAYSMSAGGSILTPDIEAFMLTPICAHSLHSRPVVYSNKSVFEADLSNEKNRLIMFCDGKQCGFVDKNSKIEIKKANFAVEFIKRDKNDFFDKLMYKLNRW